MEVWVLRHGETMSNRQRIIQGQSDTPLSDLGKKQAAHTAIALKDVVFDKIWYSDLSRTKQTAEPLKEFHSEDKVQWAADQRLREKAGGVFEGRRMGTVEAEATKQKIPARQFRPEGGESWKDVSVRAQALIADIYALSKLRLHSPPARETLPKLLLVTHGGFIREFLNCAVGSMEYKNRSGNCSITRMLLWMNADGRRRCEVLGFADESHLPKDCALEFVDNG